MIIRIDLCTCMKIKWKIFCLFNIIPQEMQQKQNEGIPQPQPRRRRGKGNNASMEQGNDFVLKRYRLEQNSTFKDKNNDEIQYQLGSPSNKEQKVQDDWDQDLVIVPLDDPEQIQEPSEKEEEVEESQVYEPPTIFIFDEDQEEENKSEVKEQEPNRNSIMEPTNIPKQQKPIQAPKAKHTIPHLHDYHVRQTSRSNQSTAQLITPKRFHERTSSDLDPFTFNVKQTSNKEQLLKKQNKYEVVNSDDIELDKIKGVEEGSDNHINIVNKKLFSISKLPSGIILRCIVKRTNNLLNMISPEYDLYLANGLKHILSVKKYPMRNRQLFKFSTDPTQFAQACLLSIMHANQSHNAFWMLRPPQKLDGMEMSLLDLVISYARLKDTEMQRKFTVFLPSMDPKYRFIMAYDQNFLNINNLKDDVQVQINNLQQWDNQVHNSTKNFVLADQDDPDYRYLQMKKQSDNIFELTIQHPLSPLQAMAIAMTRFDVQLK